MALSRQQRRTFIKVVKSVRGFAVTNSDRPDIDALAIVGLVQVSPDGITATVPMAARLAYYIGVEAL